MTVTLDLMDLLLALLGIAGLVLVVYLIITLARMQKILHEVNQMLTDVRGPIADSIRKLPELIDQVSDIGDNFEIVTQAISEDVPVMLKDVRQVTTSTREGVEAISGVVTEAGAGVKDVFSSIHNHSESIGTVTSIISEIIKVVTLLRPHQKSKGVFGSRKKRR
jgi:uncharacterized protein YoxC